jgi:hypothetical protein
MLYMHRVIMNTPANQEVDHIDRNKLNNQSHNLRNVSRSVNQWNRGPDSTNTSGYRGVSLIPLKTKVAWSSKIVIPGGKRLDFGSFTTPEDAAYIYDAATRYFRDEHAYQNFPDAETPEHVQKKFNAYLERHRL